MAKKEKVGRILLGSAVAVAALSGYLYFNERARTKVEGILNRERAKAFVRQNLKGSQSLLAAIDKLSDTEITSVVKLMDETEKVANKATDSFSNIVDKAKGFGSDVVDRVSDYIG